MDYRRSFAFLVVCSLLALGFSAGCGKKGDKLSLTGKVTYKGAMVPGGTLTLIPSDSKLPTTEARILGDGTYAVVPPGTGDMKVTIDTEFLAKQPSSGGYTYVPPEAAKYGKPEATSNPKEQKYLKIPGKYAKKESTDLKVTINPGSNKADFDLKD